MVKECGFLFLGKDPSDNSHKWKEWQLQAYVIQEARRSGYLVAGDMNAGKRNPGLARATGILAGMPDLSFFLPAGRLVMVELKLDSGKISDAQARLHGQLRGNGYSVNVVRAGCPAECWEKVRALLIKFNQLS